MPNRQRVAPLREERKEAFARRLHNLLLLRNMRPADLARASGLGRDSISGYLNAKSLPTPENVKALADALDISVQQLLGAESNDNGSAPASAFEVSAIKDRPGWVRLRMDREISFSTLVKISALLEEESRATPEPAG